MVDFHFTKIFTILEKEIKQYQAPVVELYAQNHHVFHVLISCVLSLRTNDKVTVKVCRELFQNVDVPEDILKLGLSRLKSIIKRVNFYKTKAKNMMSICKTLVEQYDSKVPLTPDELLALPNVGRKTMGIVMQYGHGKDGDYIPIDTHCNRIPNRLGWIKTKNATETEIALKKILPKKYWWRFNTLFVTFGQAICHPIGPECSRCPIRQYCPQIGVVKSR